MVFAASLLPFYRYIPQILSRLFPFQRGLTHDYWAANFWALYCGLNRFLLIVLRKFGFDFVPQGRIEECVLNVLPEISPFMTILSILLVSSLLWWRFFTQKMKFIEFCALQALIFFMFGFHVHEKAMLIPLSLYQ